MKSPRDLVKSATLDDIENLTHSPIYFHVKIALKSDGPDVAKRDMALNMVSTKAEDRHIVLGRIPTGADPIVVRESDIASLSVVFD